MKDNFNFCGTMTKYQRMQKKREARIAAGNTKLAELSKANDEAAEAYNAHFRSTQSEQDQMDNPLTWLQTSPQYAALESAKTALREYEAELNAADTQRIDEIEKRLSVLQDQAAEDGLSEEANAEMDKLEAELQKLEFPWL